MNYNLACIILASGKSVRFGSQKLLFDIDGTPVLERTIKGVPKECFAHVTAVVCDRKVEKLCTDSGIETVFYHGGPQSESVLVGLNAMKDMDGWLFLPGDQMLCGHFFEMVEAFDERLPVRLSHKGKPGSPVLYPKSWYDRLNSISGDKGGSALLSGEEVILIEADEEELYDLDTPEDLSKIKKYISKIPDLV